MRQRGWTLIILAMVALTACTDRSDPPVASPGIPTTTAPALPAACDLLTPGEIESAIGAAVRIEPSRDNPDRCRYVSDRRDEVEVTVDYPGNDSAIRSYRLLNPDAQPVEGIGDGGALRVAAGTGELVFVKGPARFFVVLLSRTATRDALLAMGRAAAPRL